MPSRGQSITVTYTAWDTSANEGKTGDGGNHTLRWVKDGVSAAPTNAPSEVDAVNAKGLYKVALTSDVCTCDEGTICGVSSTANVSIIPKSYTFERLPTAAPAANGGLPTVDASNYIAGIQGSANTLDDVITQGNIAWITATGFSTLTSQNVEDAILDAARSGHTNSGSVGELLSWLSEMSEDDAGTRRWTENSLEQAPGTASDIWTYGTRTLTSATTPDTVASSGVTVTCTVANSPYTQTAGKIKFDQHTIQILSFTYYRDGSAIDISGYTFTFAGFKRAGGTEQFNLADADFDKTDAASGTVSVTLTTTHTATATQVGRAEFKMTDADENERPAKWDLEIVRSELS